MVVYYIVQQRKMENGLKTRLTDYLVSFAQTPTITNIYYQL